MAATTTVCFVLLNFVFGCNANTMVLREQNSFDSGTTTAQTQITDEDSNEAQVAESRILKTVSDNDMLVLDADTLDLKTEVSNIANLVSTLASELKGLREAQERTEIFLQQLNESVALGLDKKVKRNTRGLQSLSERVASQGSALDSVAGSLIELTNQSSMEQSRNRHESCQTGIVEAAGYPVLPTFPAVVTVHFKTPFKNAPMVGFGLQGHDVLPNYKLGWIADIREVTNEYFKVRMVTWGDATVYGIHYGWMACPT